MENKKHSEEKSKKEKIEESLECLRKAGNGTFEFLETVIREAQYEGSIVTIVTIVPQFQFDEESDLKGCKPMAAQCKKCKV